MDFLNLSFDYHGFMHELLSRLYFTANKQYNLVTSILLDAIRKNSHESENVRTRGLRTYIILQPFS